MRVTPSVPRHRAPARVSAAAWPNALQRAADAAVLAAGLAHALIVALRALG